MGHGLKLAINSRVFGIENWQSVGPLALTAAACIQHTALAAAMVSNFGHRPYRGKNLHLPSLSLTRSFVRALPR